VHIAKQNLKVQYIVTVLSILIFLLKVVAYLMTHSLSVLSDALESVVNIVGALIGSYSLFIAAKPKDKDHPYGHGKAEFVSAAFQGSLIIGVGCLIIYKAIDSFTHPVSLHHLGSAIWLLAFIAIINIIIAIKLIRIGKKNNSLAIVSTGKLFQIDFFTTAAVAIGITLLILTGNDKIDSVIALALGIYVIYDGYKILRKSLAGIMDEADMVLLEEVIAEINLTRNEKWIDLHNLRVIKYGALMHIDCHLTVPWYFNVNEAHKAVDEFTQLIKNKFGASVEFYIHTDGCMPFSCPICTLQECEKRTAPFVKKLDWTLENVLLDIKHQLK
jgi:divalent metal cation (Fe/Co/Zn/Cd) transporter